MPADDPDVGIDQQVSEPGSDSETPLRRDQDGKPLYAEWDDEYAWHVDGSWNPAFSDKNGRVEPSQPAQVDIPAAAPVGGTDEIYDPTPVATLKEVQEQWNAYRTKIVDRYFDSEDLLDGVEKIYSTSQAAEFFGRSNQWMYWGLRKDPHTGEHVFQYKDGTPIQPERIGPGGRRRFKLPIIREIALSCYRRGNISEEELQEIMAKILLAEFGEKAFADT